MELKGGFVMFFGLILSFALCIVFVDLIKELIKLIAFRSNGFQSTGSGWHCARL